MASGNEYYDRETLYAQVWAEPVYKVAERYGVTDKAIAKACKKMHIPVPERGYWNKVNAGQALAKPPLPDFKGYPKVRRLYIQPESVVEKAPERLVPEAFALEKEVLRKEALLGMKIMYRPDVKLSNRYVLNTERNLQNSLKRKPGNYEFGRCNSRDDDAFEVSVGPDSIPRALAILQILCDALETRGYPIGPQEDPKEKQERQNGYQQREARPIYCELPQFFHTQT